MGTFSVRGVVPIMAKSNMRIYRLPKTDLQLRDIFGRIQSSPSALEGTAHENACGPGRRYELRLAFCEIGLEANWR